MSESLFKQRKMRINNYSKMFYILTQTLFIL